MTVRILEGSDAVGGRVRTDLVDGFRLDRGFQVLSTAYPEAKRVLDYEALNLQPFNAGALVRLDGRFAKVGDPFREPSSLFATLRAPVGSIADKLRVLRLRQSVTAGTPEALWQRPEITTVDALRNRYGFSEAMIDRFFRPYFGGVFLERELRSSSRAFEFYFRMFSEGAAALPATGMQAIPEQIAETLPDGSIQFNQRVMSVAPGRAVLADGEALEAKAVVVATDAPEAAYLIDGMTPPGSRSTVTIYWEAPVPPVEDAYLVLDGEGQGPINHLAVLTNAAPSYAPEGRALISASVIGNPSQGDTEVEQRAIAQMDAWFGDQVAAWRHLHSYRILHALPDQDSLDPAERPARLDEGLYVTGDHRRNGSINGAMLAGRHAADAVLSDV